MSVVPRVLLAGDLFGFPHGTGSTTRVLAMARGLQEAGADVLVMPTQYSWAPRHLNPNLSPSGVFAGVPFRYSAGTSVRPATFLDRRAARLRGLLGVASPFAPWVDPPPDGVILFTGHTVALPLLARVATAARGSVVLFDGCEQPFVYEQNSRWKALEERVYTPTAYRLFDGVLVISEHLDRYFAARMSRRARRLLVPILVDSDRFAASPRPAEPRYIAYTGVLAESKGVHILLRAFAAISGSFPT